LPAGDPSKTFSTLIDGFLISLLSILEGSVLSSMFTKSCFGDSVVSVSVPG